MRIRMGVDLGRQPLDRLEAVAAHLQIELPRNIQDWHLTVTIRVDPPELQNVGDAQPVFDHPVVFVELDNQLEPPSSGTLSQLVRAVERVAQRLVPPNAALEVTALAVPSPATSDSSASQTASPERLSKEQDCR